MLCHFVAFFRFPTLFIEGNYKNTVMHLLKDVIESLTKSEYNALKRRFPSLFWVPNIAQARPYLRWQEAPYPRVHIITFGNRTGKTEFLGEFLCGVAKGKSRIEQPDGTFQEVAWVNPEKCYSPFFDELEEKRKEGTLTIWWICEADLMKKSGVDYKIISKHIPDAKFKSRTNNGVYREIHIPVKDREGRGQMLIVQVKTHDQETPAFAGDNVDVIICDEPPPQKHWSEISARMVTLKGEVGGRILIGGTPLKLGAFLLDIIEDADDEKNVDQRIAHDEGSIWENCAGDELPDEMAEKYNIPKDPKTGIYLTYGHLSREGIENAILNWEKSGDPDEVIARVDGKFTHAQGRIYKIFNKQIHSVPDYDIPGKYPILMVCDPHDARPDAVGWFMATPANKLVCVAEYPENPFESYTSRPDDITRTCEQWRKIEADLGISKQIYMRYGDPNYMNDPDANTGQTKKQLYAAHGFNFNTNINDSLETGHEKVRRMLWYDRVKYERFSGDPSYQPHLLFFESCRNHIKYIRNYGTKPTKDPSKDFSEKPEEKWKHFADIIRYVCMAFISYEHIIQYKEKSNDEWGRIQRARRPNLRRGETIQKGRYLVSV